MRLNLGIILLVLSLAGCIDDPWADTEEAVANLSFERTPVSDVPRPEEGVYRFQVNGVIYTLSDSDAVWQHLRHKAELESLLTDIRRLESEMDFSLRRAEKIAADRDAYAANGSTMLGSFERGIYYHEHKVAFLSDRHEALRKEHDQLWERIEAHLRRHDDR